MPAARRASLGDRFAAADPGLLRLTAGLRAVLGLALTLAVLAVLAVLAGSGRLRWSWSAASRPWSPRWGSATSSRATSSAPWRPGCR
ncbi:hypothetical protein ACFRK5_22800 [Streptomyces niveus]|uniref:hypothetical protein n=1 Tax=Streptomyces niveus TaxID=193462 RepID=UPI00367BA03A